MAEFPDNIKVGDRYIGYGDDPNEGVIIKIDGDNILIFPDSETNDYVNKEEISEPKLVSINRLFLSEEMIKPNLQVGGEGDEIKKGDIVIHRDGNEFIVITEVTDESVLIKVSHFNENDYEINYKNLPIAEVKKSDNQNIKFFERIVALMLLQVSGNNGLKALDTKNKSGAKTKQLQELLKNKLANFINEIKQINEELVFENYNKVLSFVEEKEFILGKGELQKKNLLQPLYDDAGEETKIEIIERPKRISNKSPGFDETQVGETKDKIEVSLNGDELIIYHMLNINTTKATLLNDIRYNGNQPIPGDDIGHLFNMDFYVENNDIKKVQLSYNMLGFFMLLTELTHDFSDHPNIKGRNLEIINQNFINVSNELKNKLNSSGRESENNECWNNTIGVINNYNGKKKKKLSETEMGKIICALLSNDDMPRLVTANEEVNMQLYAPAYVKGTIPKFWKIENLSNKSSVSSEDERLIVAKENLEYQKDQTIEELKEISANYQHRFRSISLNSEDERRSSLTPIDEIISEVNKNDKISPEIKQKFIRSVNGLRTDIIRVDTPDLVGADTSVQKEEASDLPKNPILKTLTYSENIINFTSDADNKAAYAIPKTKNLRPISKEKYPLLDLDAGSSPQYKINTGFYSWFDSLGVKENKKKSEIPEVIVINPLDGTELINLKYGNPVPGKWNLNIQVEDQTFTENLDNLAASQMAKLMADSITEDKANKIKEGGYDMKIFAMSILKSLGDLVCYITVNMQAFMQDTKTEEMFVCNSADYSMFYPMVGAFNFINLKTNEQDLVVYDFNEKSMYLSCSVKEVQNFFVPLTLKEKHKLYLVRILIENYSNSYPALSDILFFGEKYKSGTNHKMFVDLCREGGCELKDGMIFSEDNYKIIKGWYKAQKAQKPNNVLTLILEDYLLYCYLSKLYLYKNEEEEKKEIEKEEINGINGLKNLLLGAEKLELIKGLNTSLFNEDLIPTLQNVKKNLKILMDDSNSNNNEINNNKITKEEIIENKKVRMEEVKSSFFDRNTDDVSFAEFNLSLDLWKAFYIYAEYLCEFPSPEEMGNMFEDEDNDTEFDDSQSIKSNQDSDLESLGEKFGEVGIVNGGKKSKKTKTKKQHKKKSGTRKNK